MKAIEDQTPMEKLQHNVKLILDINKTKQKTQQKSFPICFYCREMCAKEGGELWMLLEILLPWPCDHYIFLLCSYDLCISFPCPWWRLVIFVFCCRALVISMPLLYNFVFLSSPCDLYALCNTTTFGVKLRKQIVTVVQFVVFGPKCNSASSMIFFKGRRGTYVNVLFFSF